MSAPQISYWSFEFRESPEGVCDVLHMNTWMHVCMNVCWCVYASQVSYWIFEFREGPIVIIYVYTYTYTYIHTYIHTYTQHNFVKDPQCVYTILVHVNMCLYTRMYACIYVCMHACMYRCIYVCIHVYVCMYVYSLHIF